MWLLELSVAFAAGQEERCEPLGEAEFRSYVLDAQSAIDRGDIELPAAILAELDRRMVCVDFAPQPRMWAELLVCRAIVEYSRGGSWQAPLATALSIRPAIDRGVGSGHPMYAWVPPEPPPSGPPLPSGARVWVDGFLSPVAPPSSGTHLVQKTDGRFWNSVVVTDEPVPDGFLDSPVEAPPRVVVLGTGGPVFGLIGADQVPGAASDLYQPVTTRGLGVGLAADVSATFYSPVGVLFQARAVLHPRAPMADARLAGIGDWRHVTVGAGVGLSTARSWELVPGTDTPVSSTFTVTGSTARSVTEPSVSGTDTASPLGSSVGSTHLVGYAFGTAVFRLGTEAPIDLSVLAGGARGLGRAEVGVGKELPWGAERFRIGVAGHLVQVAFVHATNPELRVRENAGSLLLELEGVWGRR